MAAIRDLGVAEGVNLGMHTHEKALKDEAASVADLGMVYTHIPVDFANPTESDFQRFCAVISGVGERTVHVHCIVNARVTAFFYRYQTEVLGFEKADARATMPR